MIDHSWSAMGTHWSVAIDEPIDSTDLFASIEVATSDFEQRFSRFIETSEASAFRHARPGVYTISNTFAQLLSFCDELRKLTLGSFDPAVGTILELAGYDPSYSFHESRELSQVSLPNWSINEQQLVVEGPIVFDIGGIGKGYWIDSIATLLKQSGITHFLVEGGGDMVATTKSNGSPWTVALESPGDTTRAIGTIKLLNQGLAVSDVYKRAWGKWHHLIDAKNHRPQSQLLWAACCAPSALAADMLTSLLSFGSRSVAQDYAQQSQCSFAVLDGDFSHKTSEGWTGTMFWEEAR